MEQKYRVNARNMNAGSFSFSSGIVYRLSSIVFGAELKFHLIQPAFISISKVTAKSSSSGIREITVALADCVLCVNDTQRI